MGAQLRRIDHISVHRPLFLFGNRREEGGWKAMRNKTVTLVAPGVVTITMVLGSSLASDHNEDMAGAEFHDGAGSTNNETRTVDLGTNSLVTHLGYTDIVLCTESTSWVNECAVLYGNNAEGGLVSLSLYDGSWTNTSGDGNGLQAQCTTGDPAVDNGPTTPMSLGLTELEGAGIPAIELADGILTLEFFESYDDGVGALDATCVSGSLNVQYQAEGEEAQCSPSLNPLCTMDQAGSGAYSNGDGPDGVPESGDEINIPDRGNGSVGLEDFSGMLVSFGTSVDPETAPRPVGDGAPCPDPDDSDGTYDCSGDCAVDLSDFSALLVDFGKSGADCGDMGFCHYTDGTCIEQTFDECSAQAQPNDANIALYWIDAGAVNDIDLDGDIDCEDAWADWACCDGTTGTCTDTKLALCEASGGTFSDGLPCSDPSLACVALPNDNCDADLSAYALTIGSSTPYDTTGANTDGTALCDEYDGQTYHDLWYKTTAVADGGVRITTCATPGTTSYDSDLVAYVFANEVDFLARDCATMVPSGCNDDSATCDDGVDVSSTYHSDLTVGAVTGNVVLIRVGGWNDGDQGAGILTVETFLCDPAYERPDSCVAPYPTSVVNNGLHGNTAYFMDDREPIDTDADGTPDMQYNMAVEFSTGDASGPGVTFQQARLMFADLSSPPASGTGTPGVDGRVRFYNITGVDLETINWCDSSSHPPLLLEQELFTSLGTLGFQWTGNAWNIGETVEVSMTLDVPLVIAGGLQVLMVPEFDDLPVSAYNDNNGDGVIDALDDQEHFLWNVEINDFCAAPEGPHHRVGPYLEDTDGDEIGDTCANIADLEPDGGFTSFAYQLCD